MDEGKQNNGFFKEAAKKGFDKLKEKTKQFFKKVTLPVVFAIIKALSAAIIIIVLLVAVNNFLDKVFGNNSKESNKEAVNYIYTYNNEKEENQPNEYKIIVNPTNVTKDGRI